MQQCLKVVLILPFFLFTFLLSGQQGSVSPYSRFGIGDFQSQHHARLQGMGGASLAVIDSLNINLDNPASLTGIGYTTFELGFHFGNYRQQQENPSIDFTNSLSGLQYLSVGISPKKWWGTGFSFRPYTFKGYDISTTRSGPDSITVLDNYQGKGGLSQITWSNGFQVAEGLSIGANASYLFGTVEEENFLDFSSGLYNTFIEEAVNYKGFKFDFGAQYRHQLENNLMLSAGLTFSNASSLDATLNQRLYSITSSGTIIDTLNSTEDILSEATLPTEFGIGLHLAKRSTTEKHLNAWGFGLDYHNYQGSKYKSYRGTNDLTDAFRIEVGGFVTPILLKEGSGVKKGYVRKVEYRIGGYFENTPLVVGGEQLKDYGITFGLGLPVSKGKKMPGEVRYSQINLALSLGQRGTLDKGLIQESYLKFHLGLTLNDKWFKKYKYY